MTFFSFNSPYYFVYFVLIFLAVSFSYYIYRSTNPPIPRINRYFLFTLRAISISLILLMIAEPILSTVIKKEIKPVIGVLVDVSGSMGIVDKKQGTGDKGQRRIDIVSELLEKSEFSDLRSKYDIKFYPFSDELFSTNVDYRVFRTDTTLIKKSGETNIGSSIRDLVKNNEGAYLCGIIILSDGANNLGPDPVRISKDIGIPITTIGVGESNPQKDISIVNVLANEIVYVDDKVPVEVTVRSFGFGGTKISINLFQDKELLASENLTLSDIGGDQKIKLTFIPKKEGVYKYVISTPVRDGELIAENNWRVFLVKVLKNKIRVLLISGEPSWDHTFLKYSLEKDKNIEVRSLIGKKGGGFYPDKGKSVSFPSSQESLFENDIIILQNVNRDVISANQENWILNFVNNKGGALIVIGGENSYSFYSRSALSSAIPIQFANGIYEQNSYIRLSQDGLNHPIMQLDEKSDVNQRIWNDFPPLLGCNLIQSIKPGAVVLATHDKLKVGNKPYPLISVQVYGAGKTMAMPVFSHWRWSILAMGFGSMGNYYDKLWGNAIRWLISREELKRVKITTNKRIYRSGEKVYFSAQVYDENYKPLDGATVHIKVQFQGEQGNQKDKKNKEPITITLSPTGTQGQYEGEIKALPSGDYIFSGSAKIGENNIGDENGKFTVSEYSLEFENTQLDRDLLQSIAKVSNGKYYESNDISGLSENLKFENKIISNRKDTELWHHYYFFIAVVLFLCIEWTLRKRWGLM